MPVKSFDSPSRLRENATTLPRPATPTTTSSRRSSSPDNTATESTIPLRGAALVDALQKNGWSVTYQRGSHVCLELGSIISVQPGRVLPMLTLKNILADVDIYD